MAQSKSLLFHCPVSQRGREPEDFVLPIFLAPFLLIVHVGETSPTLSPTTGPENLPTATECPQQLSDQPLPHWWNGGSHAVVRAKRSSGVSCLIHCSDDSGIRNLRLITCELDISTPESHSTLSLLCWMIAEPSLQDRTFIGLRRHNLLLKFGVCWSCRMRVQVGHNKRRHDMHEHGNWRTRSFWAREST